VRDYRRLVVDLHFVWVCSVAVAVEQFFGVQVSSPARTIPNWMEKLRRSLTLRGGG